MAQKITNDLLKQAIADAEAVRETAVANAKLVLEQSITPQIRDMIQQRLVAESVEESAEVNEEEVSDDLEEVQELEEEKAAEKPHEDGEAEGSSQMPADSSDVGHGENKQPSDDASDASDIGNGGENESDGSTDWYDDWNESEFDLDEVIKELEEDINALSEMDHEDDDGDEDADDDMEVEASPIGAHGEDAEEERSQKHPSAHANASLKTDGEDPMGDEDGMGDEDDDLDLEAILRELEADDDDSAEAPVAGHGDMDGMGGEEDDSQMAQDLARFKKDLDEYKEAVKILRSRLQEANLLNAKMLFTNKLFSKGNLTTEQKIRIVESFDRATTTREVKLVYTALVENLASAARSINSSRRKIVAEGLASKATPSTAPKASEEKGGVIVENAVARRLQQLAGIIN